MKYWFSKLSTTYRWIIQPALVIGILLFGFFGAMGLSLFKQEPERSEPAVYAPLVKTIVTQPENKTVLIKGNGTIEARTRINIVPQVGGRIDYIHPHLRAGGNFNAGEILLKIEQIDYELAVTQAKGDIAAAYNALQTETAEAEAAVLEWQAINPESPAPALVARQPQIASAKASLQSAKAQLQQAQLNLRRTRISMPFSGRVVQSTMDVGEVISANNAIGVVYSNELYEIPVPLEIDKLAWLDIPDQNDTVKANTATILVVIAGQTYRLVGRVIRVESELNSISRLARVVIDLKSDDIPQTLREEVIPGLFVDVEIEARQLENISVIPKSAKHDDGQLWILKDQHLQFVPAEVAYQSDSELWVHNLPAETQIITSTLDVVTNGMQVRTEQQKK
jgi:RND family efflux transporter MFP subunit